MQKLGKTFPVPDSDFTLAQNFNLYYWKVDFGN